MRCREAADVTAALALGDRVVVRGGGHCFAGRSSTKAPSSTSARWTACPSGTATASRSGAGARLGARLRRAECARPGDRGGLRPDRRHWRPGARRRPGASSAVDTASPPTRSSRREVVLADGTVVECDEHQEPDLFWALRGAGGGQFGVVTRLTLRTVPAPATTTLHLRWPHQAAAAVIDAWQAWAPDAPDELAASLLVTAGPRPGAAACRARVRGDARQPGRGRGVARRARCPTPSTAKLHELAVPRRQAPPRRARTGRGSGHRSAHAVRQVRVLPAGRCPPPSSPTCSPTSPPIGSMDRCASSTSPRGAAPTTASRRPPPRSPIAPSGSCSSTRCSSPTPARDDDAARRGCAAHGRSSTRGQPAASTPTSPTPTSTDWPTRVPRRQSRSPPTRQGRLRPRPRLRFQQSL